MKETGFALNTFVYLRLIYTPIIYQRSFPCLSLYLLTRSELITSLSETAVLEDRIQIVTPCFDFKGRCTSEITSVLQ